MGDKSEARACSPCTLHTRGQAVKFFEGCWIYIRKDYLVCTCGLKSCNAAWVSRRMDVCAALFLVSAHTAPTAASNFWALYHLSLSQNFADEFNGAFAEGELICILWFVENEIPKAAWIITILKFWLYTLHIYIACKISFNFELSNWLKWKLL